MRRFKEHGFSRARLSGVAVAFGRKQIKTNPTDGEADPRIRRHAGRTHKSGGSSVGLPRHPWASPDVSDPEYILALNSFTDSKANRAALTGCQKTYTLASKRSSRDPMKKTVILPTIENGTFHTNPKRKRGNELTPSLALRVGVICSRGEYSSAGLAGFAVFSEFS